jgi:hypothetical protein
MRTILVPSMVLLLGACAQLLSYDDYRARDELRVDAAPSDVVEDTAPVRPGKWPPRPTGAAAPSGKGQTRWFGVRRFTTGTTTPEGWRTVGYDLDDRCTTTTDTAGTCTRAAGAEANVVADGADCRDNNFGKLLASLASITGAIDGPGEQAIAEGGSTWLLRIDDIDGSDDAYAPGKLYNAALETTPPKWDGTDVRSVVSSSLLAGNLETPIGDFPSGYIRGGVWVSGNPLSKVYVLPITAAYGITLVLEGSLVTLDLEPPRGTPSRGVLVGAIPMSDADKFYGPIAANVGKCPGSIEYNLARQTIERFPDLVKGTPGLQRAGVACDALSLGLGFEVLPVRPATKVVPPRTLNSPCGDAGTSAEAG